MEGFPESEVITIQPRSLCSRYFSWLRHVCVEPTMWLYMMAYMITSVIELAFFVHKACRVDHGFSEEICAIIHDNKSLMTEVQITVTEFTQWNNIIGHVFPIFLSLFYGNWSDRYGRKLPLLIGLFGKFIYSMMIVVNTIMDDWNLNMVIWTATLPMGMLGGDVAIFASAFAYISDVSSLKQRTLRITILDVVYLSTMPLGIALGSFLFKNVVHKSYTIMFIINTSLLVLAILYSLVNLEWQTSEQQSPISGSKALMNFFDKKHAIETTRTLTKSRYNHGRLYLWIILLAMLFYTFQRDEKPISYLYTQLVFGWDETSFSKFRTVQSTLFVLVMFVGAPLFSKVLKISDTVIVMIGALSHASGRILFALAKEPKIFYLGAVVAAIGPVVAPSLRSMVSKLVQVEERGKVFAMLSVCDNAVPFLSGVLYNQLYKATINSMPNAIYWLTFTTQIIVLLLILVINLSSASNQLNPDDYAFDDDSTSNQRNLSENERSNDLVT